VYSSFNKRNNGIKKHNKYEYVKPETEVFSSDTACNCIHSICKCDRDNPTNRLSDEGFGRVQDELSEVQQEDYDAVYGLDSLPKLFGNNDIINSQFDSNDDLPKQAGQE